MKMTSTIRMGEVKLVVEVHQNSPTFRNQLYFNILP